MRRARLLAVAVSLLCVGTVAIAAPPAQPAAAATTAAGALHALFAKAWNETHARPPIGATSYKLLWGDPSLAHEKAQIAQDDANLAALKKIDFAALDPNDQLSYRLFQYQLKDAIAAGHFPNDQIQTLMTQLWGPQLDGTRFRHEHFADAAGYEGLIRRLNALGPYLAAFTQRLQQGIAAGVTQPRAVMVRIPDEIKANIAADPTRSPFYAPFERLPDSIPAAKRQQLQQQAQAAIRDGVTPAYRKFLAFFQNDYLPHARSVASVSNLPNGKAYYAYLVRHYTTTDMTPQQVHDLGLKLVKQIHVQMDAVMKQTGFKGSYHDFLHYLRTNPRFYYRDPQELLQAYEAAVERVNGRLTRILSVWLMPRVPLGVEVIPASLAPNIYPAYANPPFVSVNLYKPGTRPKYSIQVLMCHEGRPGHNLQIPVADELSNLPPFRRFAYYNAFGEGWALYSETLCNDPMDLYDNAYSKFGYLNYQMWRAARLVVDTGIHEDGWTRAQAVKYMQDNTALTDQNIDTEVDRYIVWPGQALSYMIGEQTILKLRREAKQRLGAKYNLKNFDDVVIGQGSLPLAVLQEVVNRWIDNTLAGKPVDQLPYACKPRSIEPCAVTPTR
ncbi:MAG TPA: DUF885 domain-containing protein [Rhodanobacteraceae bacterium]